VPLRPSQRPGGGRPQPLSSAAACLPQGAPPGPRRRASPPVAETKREATAPGGSNTDIWCPTARLVNEAGGRLPRGSVGAAPLRPLQEPSGRRHYWRAVLQSALPARMLQLSSRDRCTFSTALWPLPEVQGAGARGA